MRLFALIAVLTLMSACTVSPARLGVASVEKETYLPVVPTQKTKVVTYHVQAEKLSAGSQIEFERALASLNGKCWVWASPSSRETLTANEPDSCLKFANFTSDAQLKPYKRDPTDKKMLLIGLEAEGHIQLQNFVWNGARLQRVRNSDSYLGGRSFQDLMMLAALK